jgi:hypothetical protein
MEPGREIAEVGINDLQITRQPKIVLSQAKEVANELKAIVDAKGLTVKIGAGEHLQFEAWQLLATFFGITVKVEGTQALMENDAFYGYEASAVALRNGEVISRAESMCCKDEANWGNKPRFQLRSMAQTRACGKALRQVLSFVVSLSGYQPTPAEEMEGVYPDEDMPAQPKQYAPKKHASTGGPSQAQINFALKIVEAGGPLFTEADFRSMSKFDIGKYIEKNKDVLNG